MIFLFVLIILALDQFTKFFVTENLILNQSIPLIKGVLHFTLIHNRGAAFGILKNQTPVFIITAILAIILIYFNLRDARHKKLAFGQNSQPVSVVGKVLYTFPYHKKSLLFKISLSLILAGALGNLIDRIFFGYVIDFLDFRIWPVFNVADSAITVGAILLGYCILKVK